MCKALKTTLFLCDLEIKYYMDQESSKYQIEAELKAFGGMPFTHDKLFREVFQWVELAKAFLRIVLPGPVLAKLDLERLTIEPKDFLSIIFKETRADIIYRIPIIASKENLCVYVLLEHKSYNDIFTIFQADQYAAQISQKEYRQADDEKRLNAEFRFSPVVAIIFHHGERAFTGPTEVAELYEDHGVLVDYLPHRRAILFDLSTLPEIPDDPNVPELYAVLRIMQTIFSLDLGMKTREVLERLHPYAETPKYRRLIRFLWYYFVSYAKKRSVREVTTVTDAVIKIIGEKNMSTLLEQFQAEGLAIGQARGEARGEARGIAIGEARGEAKSIIRTLARNHGTVPESLAEQVREITDIETLDRLFDLAFDCESLEEFEKAIQSAK